MVQESDPEMVPGSQTQREPLVVETQTEHKKQSFFERFAVLIVFTIFVTFRAADRVFMKALSNGLHRNSYNLIWSNLFWPIAIQIMTLIMIVGYIQICRWQGDSSYNMRFFLPGSELASSMGPVALYKLALFSLGDQVNAAMQSPASPFVSQPVQSVMTNWMLIWMAIVAFFWIKARFMQVHYVGMTLVIIATLVQMSTPLTDNDCSLPLTKKCLASYHSPLNGGEYVKLSNGQMIMWYVLFLISTIPAAVGSVYKQKVLQEQDVDVFYATWWSGNFQVLWGLICLPLMFLPLPGQETLKPSDLFAEIGNFWGCVFGGTPHGESDATCAQGTPVWFWIVLYLCFNISFNMCMTWLVKRISAAWAQVATVLCLGLCNIFSTQKWIMGDSAEQMSFNDYLGVIIVCIALWVYNLEEETTAGGKKIIQQQGGSFVSDGHANTRQQVAGAKAEGSFAKPSSFVEYR